LPPGGETVRYANKFTPAAKRRVGAGKISVAKAPAQAAQSLNDAEGVPDAHSGVEARPTGIAGILTTISFVLGSIALLLAMTTDAAAVVGRHIGVPLLGSIEIVQACVVVAASSAMVGATLSRSHATVHILLERLPPKARALTERFGDLLAAGLFAFLLSGSSWIASDLWDGHERTELLHLPLIALRLFWCASAALILALFLIRAVLGPRREPAA